MEALCRTEPISLVTEIILACSPPVLLLCAHAHGEGRRCGFFLKCTRWFKLCALFRRFLFFSREQTAGVSTRSAPRSVPATDLPHGNPFVSCFPQEGRVGRLLKQGLWCALYTRRAVCAGAMPRGQGPRRGPRGNGTRI